MSFVSCGLECSSILRVTAVDTPLCASKEASVFRKSWDFRLGKLAAVHVFSYFLELNLSGNSLSCPLGSVAT
jgi:hypothetical protein